MHLNVKSTKGRKKMNKFWDFVNESDEDWERRCDWKDL